RRALSLKESSVMGSGSWLYRLHRWHKKSGILAPIPGQLPMRGPATRASAAPAAGCRVRSGTHRGFELLQGLLALEPLLLQGRHALTQLAPLQQQGLQAVPLAGVVEGAVGE